MRAIGIMRERLKQETDAVHRRLDDAFSLLDLSNPEDYRVFLAANADAYRAVLDALPPENALAETIGGLHALLLGDIAALTGEAHRRQLHKTPDTPHSLGVQYVLAGSHFGKRVLTKRWSKSQDARVLAAGAFLANDVLPAMWPTTLKMLDDIDPKNDEANVIVYSAHGTFSIFHDSLNQHSTQRVDPLSGPRTA